MRSHTRMFCSTFSSLMIVTLYASFLLVGLFLQTTTAFAQSGLNFITTDPLRPKIHMDGCPQLGGGLGSRGNPGYCAYSDFGYMSCPAGDTCDIPLSFVPSGYQGDVWVWMWCSTPWTYDCQILPVSLPPPAVISGLVTDAETGAGLPGNQPPFASASLEQCVDYGYWGYCYPLRGTLTDSQGHFRFEGNFEGNLRVRITADPWLYEQPVVSPAGPKGYESVPITLGTNYDFGVIPLVPVVPVDSISGQVIDRVTGRPMAGSVEPFARVQLYRRSGWGGWEFQAESPTAQDGTYRFTSANVGHPILRGDYQIVGYANQYQTIENSVDALDVQPREVRIAAALRLQSNPVRITDVKGCDTILAQGGPCAFSYKVTSGTAKSMVGMAWSLVRAWGTGGFTNGTNFAACEQPLTLVSGTPAASQAVRCTFTVPAGVPAWSLFCVDARFGEDSRANPYMTVQGAIDPLFCLWKVPGEANFKVLPQRAAVELMRKRGMRK